MQMQNTEVGLFVLDINTFWVEFKIFMYNEGLEEKIETVWAFLEEHSRTEIAEDVLDEVRNEAAEEAHEIGREDGYDSGYETGYDDGEYVGEKRGYEKGYDEGYVDGHRMGKSLALNELSKNV